MKRSDFLKAVAMTPAALLAPMQAASPARMVFPDGRVVPWTGGRIDSETLIALECRRITFGRYTNKDYPVVWVDPAAGEIGVYANGWRDQSSARLPPDLEVIDAGMEDEWDAVVRIRTPHVFELYDGRRIYSVGA